jgi:O-antigen/teichoic acid export membrane protein
MIFGSSLIGYALAAPLILLLTLFRFMFYVRSAPRLAAGASGVYMVAMLAVTYLLYRSATLSAFTAPLATAGASAVAIAGIIGRWRFQLWSRWQDAGFVRSVARAHWRYGRWAVATNALEVFPGVFYFLIVPQLVGLEANAALRALYNLIIPAIQATGAFSYLLVPAFGRLRQRGGDATLVWKALIVLVGGACLYALVIAEFGRPLMDLLYGGRYTDYAHFAWLVGLIPIPVAALTALNSFFRAHERPDLVLWANMISAAVTCVFGSAAVAIWGLLGAILGMVGGQVTTMIVVLYYWVLRADTGVVRKQRSSSSKTKGRMNDADALRSGK